MKKKAELFSHNREPAITIWDTRIKFNMACLRRFPGVTHIQLLIHPEQKHPPIYQQSATSSIHY